MGPNHGTLTTLSAGTWQWFLLLMLVGHQILAQCSAITLRVIYSRYTIHLTWHLTDGQIIYKLDQFPFAIQDGTRLLRSTLRHLSLMMSTYKTASLQTRIVSDRDSDA